MKHKEYHTNKSYYGQAFTTKISHATAHEQELKEQFGLELVSQYYHTKLLLLDMVDINHSGGLSTNTVTYYIKLGTSILGKLYIMQQYLNDDNVTILYNYRERITDGKYHHQNNVKQNRRRSKSTKHQYFRRKLSLSVKLTKKYKEK